ncbi:unnamed protein product [Penicillium salamii]|uniref:Uncharacterized protein n=1 Tax=Penicillium salamii TaxID=1612424 RepID=A0A9W4JVD6_9EURO|nr:unnamed protein product [Penicillium salamii]
MWSTITTLIALPILAIISIPLILSAWVTISIALIALILRISVIYVELVFGILVHFLSVPTSPTSSLLTFVASEPPTPVSGRSRRNSNHAAQRKHDPPSSWALGSTVDNYRKKNSYARSMIEAHLSPSTPYGFPISGDERRDFEGVGGWRSYPSKARSSNEKPAWTSSSSSISDVDPTVDADERAWLSLNNRLELPSQLITLSTSTYGGSTLNSPLGENESRNGRNFQSLLEAADPASNGLGSRHHHRSLTTSSLTTSDRRTGMGLSLALSTRADNAPNSREHISVSSSTPRLPPPFMTPQPFAPSHSQPRAARGSQNGAQFSNSYLSSSGELGHSFGSNSSGSFDRGGGYFSLRRPGSSGSHVSGMVSPIASGYTTPGVGMSTEERDAASLASTRLMAHYPTSPRHRRQSVSGTARGVTGERI